jgi:hypothetical protein
VIHHLSIAVQNPQRVAIALAELMKGYQRAFPPNPGSFTAFQLDEHGTCVEIHPAGAELRPEGRGFEATPPRNLNFSPTHFALSVKRSISEIQEICDREGWTCRRNDRAEFPVMEIWIENTIMFEALPPEFAQKYLEITNAMKRQIRAGKIPTGGPRPA